MASYKDGRLTQWQIGQLASKISPISMETIAEGYMDITSETIQDMKYDTSDSHSFKTAILKHWKNVNPGKNQTEV